MADAEPKAVYGPFGITLLVVLTVGETVPKLAALLFGQLFPREVVEGCATPLLVGVLLLATGGFGYRNPFKWKGKKMGPAGRVALCVLGFGAVAAAFGGAGEALTSRLERHIVYELRPQPGACRTPAEKGFRFEIRLPEAMTSAKGYVRACPVVAPNVVTAFHSLRGGEPVDLGEWEDKKLCRRYAVTRPEKLLWGTVCVLPNVTNADQQLVELVFQDATDADHETHRLEDVPCYERWAFRHSF